MGKSQLAGRESILYGQGVPEQSSPVAAAPTRRAFWVVLFVFVILAICYSLVVPLTQGEDELAHYRYLSFIAQTGRLPASYAEREQAWYRADWPPLYHLLVGWAVSWLDTSQPHLKDVGESPRRRLVGEIFYPRLIVYTEDANWPWQDGILAWRLGRFISIAFAAGALVFTYMTVLDLCRGAEEQGSVEREAKSEQRGVSLSALRFPLSAPLLALAATAMLAFTPRFLFTSAMLGDDSLFILLSAVFIWLLLRALRGDDSWRRYALMGLLLGLSITTKYSTVLLPLTIIPVVWRRGRQAGWRSGQAVGRVALAWLFTVIGASWWFGWIIYHFNTVRQDGLILGLLRPVLASGPDVSMRRVFALFTASQFTGPERPDAIAAGTFWDWLRYLFQTFWGVPVLEQDPFFPWAYLIMLLFCLLAMAGLWQIWRMANRLLRLTLFLLVFIVLLLLPFPLLRFFLTHNVLETGQGRHLLYPAAQAIPILLTLGWATVVGRMGEWANGRGANPLPKLGAWRIGNGLNKTLRFTLYALYFIPFAFLLSWSIFLLAYMTRTYPDPLPVQTTTFDPAAIPQPLKRNFGEDIQFLGYDFTPDPAQAMIHLTLYWRSLRPVEQNYRTRVQLVDPQGQGQPHFTWLSHPLNGRYPTRAWDQGDVVRDELSLPLAAVPPHPYALQIDLLHETEDVPLNSEPFQPIQFDLPARQPIADAAKLGQVDYRLWLDDAPARYRQTIPLSWSYPAGAEPAQVKWTLIGPDEVRRPPAAAGERSAIFMVGADWPSGDYRLQLDPGGTGLLQTGPVLTVANADRLFSLPAGAAANLIPLEAVFADLTGRPQFKLLGYSLPSRRFEPGGGLPLTLYWQSLAPVLPDSITFAVLLDSQQQPYGQIDRYPSGYYSPILWAEGEVVIDDFVLPVQPDAPPGVYQLHIGQYYLVNGRPQSLPLLQQGQLTDQSAVVIGPLKVGGPPPDVVVTNPKPQVSLNQSFGDQITLLGYDLTLTAQDSPLNPPTLNLTLYWRADTDLQTDFTTFLHLRNRANETVTQKDSPPAGGLYPTSLWQAGEVIGDELSLSLVDIPAGEYTPVVGLYEFESGARLTVPGSSANEVPLQQFRWEK